MTTHYTETDPLDWGDVVAVPHFTITVETSREIYGDETSVTADLTHVMLGHLCPRGRVDGIELTADQAIRVWGLPAVIEMEAAAAAGFDWQATLRDEADDRADYLYERKRDERMGL
jgi:hypothetical protein